MTPVSRVLEHNLTVFRKTWLSVSALSLVSPLLFLAAMGLGLGSLVRRSGGGSVEGVSYVRFLAPGLLVATAMQTAARDTTYPIMARLRWNRVYEAMLASPLAVGEILAGEVAWLGIRLLMTSALFFAAMACFGVLHSPVAVLAVPVATLTGLAFGVPILAFSATQRTDLGFAVIERFVVLPLLLLAGTFFPIGQLPGGVQAVVWLTPLSHGVVLARQLTLGSADAVGGLLHLGVCGIYVGLGWMLAARSLRRRLVV